MLATAAHAHPFRFHQRVERALGGLDAADVLDLGACHRLVVGDHRQDLECRARQLLLLHGVAAHQECQVAGGAEGPGIANADEIDAAPLVDALQFGHCGGNVDAFGQARNQLAFAHRLGAGEDDGLGHAHGLCQMQSGGGIALDALVIFASDGKWNDRSILRS